MICLSFGLLFLQFSSIFGQSREKVLHDMNYLLINTVMDDVFGPTVSCRIYTYPNIAFYECIRHEEPDNYTSLAGKLNGLSSLPEPAAGTKIDYFISACVAFSKVGQSLVGSEYKMEDWRKAFLDSIKTKQDNDLINASVAYGIKVADSLIAWMKKDQYAETRGMSRYVYSKKAGKWQPTPIDFAQALEPHWNAIRPMVLRSAAQFSPAKKLTYNMSAQSVFHKNVMEVYNIRKKMDTVKKAIALYWDDNPNISVEEGHFNYFIHKISPSGHWMMIARQACMEKNISLLRASQAYALTGIAMFDAFIACWDEKFKVELIRPVTVINHYIDEKWEPLIQTPPFPEFTSGHAVVSNAAATVLTRLLGDNYHFTDHTEIPFGIAPRSFTSFLKAAEESSWSRVYGGIHYPETARISIEQGKTVGKYVLTICGIRL